VIVVPTATKASGFRGAKTDKWWTKDSAHGVRYQCSACGRITLGMYGRGSGPEMHKSNCPRLASPGARP
jgi:hypothetical protein